MKHFSGRYYLIISLLLMLTASYLIPVIFPLELAWAWQEDGMIENIGAIFFGISAILLFNTFYRLRKNPEVKKFVPFWILSLGLLFFVALGEEISWGQRIFNFATPESIREINEQHEFNIHNIKVFHGLDEEGNKKTGLAALFTSHRLFYALLIGYFIILPLVMLKTNWLSRIVTSIQVPVVPIWIGSIFLAAIFLAKLMQFLFTRTNPDLYHGLVEIMETNIAFVCLLLGLSFYKSDFHNR